MKRSSRFIIAGLAIGALCIILALGAAFAYRSEILLFLMNRYNGQDAAPPLMAQTLHGMPGMSNGALDLPGSMQMNKGIADSVSPGETKKHEINIDRCKQISFTCFANGNLRLAAIDPSGARFDSSAIKFDETNQYANMEMEEGQNMIVLALGNNPPPGKWILEVSSSKKNSKTMYYVVMTSFEGSDITLDVKTDKDHYFRGDTILVSAILTDKSSPLIDAKVDALAWQTREHADTIFLYDDGAHGDSSPNDGRYANFYPLSSQTGEIFFSVKATKEGAEPFTRYGSTMAGIARSRARLTGQFSDYGLDTDGDKMFDELIVEAGINVTDPDTFMFGAQLRVPDGPNGKPAPGDEYIASCLGSFSADTFLTAGEHKLLIAFDGKYLNDKHHNGPYQFEQLSVSLFDTSGSQGVDYYNGIYLTKKYSYWDFQGGGILLDSTISDRGLDTDGDGLYDSLLVTIETDLRESDYYHWQGILFYSMEPDCSVYAFEDGNIDSGKKSVTVAFDGRKIGRGGKDGPYEVQAGIMYGTKGESSNGQFFHTKAYKVSQFEK